MVHYLRKYQQTLMLIVTVLVIISFVWFYNVNRDPGGARSQRAGVIYDRTVTVAEQGREARKFEIARSLMLFEMLQTLVGQARSMDDAMDQFVWNSIILRHEADALGITATEAEVMAAIQKIPMLQTNGVYDSSKYVMLIERVLNPKGLSPDALEDLVRDDLRLQKIKTLLGTTIAAAPSEVRAAFERRNRKMEASVVRVKREDFEKTAQAPDEDVKKLYEERKETLKSDEERAVKAVAFILEKTDKPLAGKERVDAMSKLADKAQELTVAMTEKEANLEELAKAAGVEVKEIEAFSLDDPPEELGESQEVAKVVFEKLSTEQPNSDVILTENGYYVVQLAGITPSRPLTFDEAKSKLADQLKKERTDEALNLKGAEVRTKMESELKAGKTFAEAATAAGVTAEAIPAFSPVEPPKAEVTDSRTIMGRSMDLEEGQLSDPTPTPTGLLFVRVEKRLPIDEAKFEQEKALLAQNVARSKREAVFAEWLKARRAAANIQSASGLQPVES